MAEKIVKLDITATERTDSGELRVKLSENDSTGVLSDATMWGIDGFYSRPNDPDDDGTCQALLAYEGNNRRVIATKDNRIVSNYATMAPGDRSICTKGAARLLLKQANASVSMATANDDGLVLCQVTPTAFTVMVPGAGSSAMVQVKADRIVLMVNNGGSLIIDKDGVHIGGPLAEVNTGMVTLGMMAPSVPLVPGVNSALIGPSGMVGLPSSKVLIAGP